MSTDNEVEDRTTSNNFCYVRKSCCIGKAFEDQCSVFVVVFNLFARLGTLSVIGSRRALFFCVPKDMALRSSRDG